MYAGDVRGGELLLTWIAARWACAAAAVLALIQAALISCAHATPVETSATSPTESLTVPVVASFATASIAVHAARDANDSLDAHDATPLAASGRKQKPPGEFTTGPGRPRLWVGAFSVKGGLAPEVVQKVLRRYSMGVIRCYEAALQRDATLEGRVRVKIEIDPHGVVTTSDDGSELPDSDAVDCIVAVFADIELPPADGGGGVSLSYPMSLAPPVEP